MILTYPGGRQIWNSVPEESSARETKTKTSRYTDTSLKERLMHTATRLWKINRSLFHRYFERAKLKKEAMKLSKQERKAPAKDKDKPEK